MKTWPDGCGNSCWEVGCTIVCRIGRCVAYNEIFSCAYCAAFPCEDQLSGAYQSAQKEENVAYHAIILERLAQVRATLSLEEIKPLKLLKPHRVKIVDFPSNLAVSETERKGLRMVYQLLVRLITCESAETYIARIIMENNEPHMLDVLWQMGLYGDLFADQKPCLWMEKKHSRKMGVSMPDCSQELARFGRPYIQVENIIKKLTSPKNWETRISMMGDHEGLDALRGLQKYVHTLCAVYGKPDAQGSHRYTGKAYECFSHADMNVFAEGIKNENAYP
jgi:hypothetical protein